MSTPAAFTSLPLDLQDLAEIIDNTLTFGGSTMEALKEWEHENRPVTNQEWRDILAAVRDNILAIKKEIRSAP